MYLVMKKVLALCSSDILGIPALLRLKQQDSLAAIAIPAGVAGQLIPILLNYGFSGNDIHVLSKKTLEVQLRELIAAYQPDALFTFTFSWMIPDPILNLLPKRCVNFHYGLLPRYKGAEPVFWQLRNGDEMGGISIHIMTSDLDNGPMLMVEELPVYKGETYGLYAQRLGALAAETAVKLLDELDTIEPAPVNTSNEPALFLKAPTWADLTINWQQHTAAEIECLVNASNPRYSGAITSFKQTQINFFEVAPAEISNQADMQHPPGTIIYADLLYGLIVACINKQFLKINVAFIQQGYFSGSKLFSMGFKAGEAFI
jgi:methionyl-tRNA formyltransferase